MEEFLFFMRKEQIVARKYHYNSSVACFDFMKTIKATMCPEFIEKVVCSV